MSSHEFIGIRNGNTTTDNNLMYEAAKPEQTIGHGKKKRPPPSENEQNPSKIKCNYNDDNELEESLDSESELSNTSSTSYINLDSPKNKQLEGNINNNTKQPPIIIILNGNYTALSI